MKKLSLQSELISEPEMDWVLNKVSCISERYLAIGEVVKSADLLKEGIALVRDCLGRLAPKGSRSFIGDGVKLNNIITCRLLVKLGDIYYNEMKSSSEVNGHAISYYSEAHELLAQKRVTSIYDVELLQLSMSCDSSLYNLYLQAHQFEKAKYHCVRCLAAARVYRGPGHIYSLVASMSGLSLVYVRETKFSDALALAEEAYILSSKHYSPAHKMVLQASNQMISCLISLKDYSTADTYCRINYSNFTDPMNAEEYCDQDGISILDHLTNIWLEKEPDGDMIVAKALADEAIDFSRKLCALSVDSRGIRSGTQSLSILCRVLLKANQLNEETEGLMHQLVTTCIADNDLNNRTIHNSIVYLSEFYFQLVCAYPIYEISLLARENAEACDKRSSEIKCCTDGSYLSIKGSLTIKPCFKKNKGFCV